MSRKKIGIMLAVATFALPVAVSAQTGADPMRCEALQLRHEARLHTCIARCDVRSEREAKREARLAERKQQREVQETPSCEDSCHARYEAARALTDSRPPCAAANAEESMTPSKCKARLLRAKATWMLCHSRCHGRALKREGFDENGCMDSCDSRYVTSVDVIRSVPGCSEAEMPAELETRE